MQLWCLSAYAFELLEWDHESGEALKNTTEPDSGVWTETVLPQAPAALVRMEQGGRLLDIGAGAGIALIHDARRFPGAEVVGVSFDEPSYRFARRAVADAGVGDRVEVHHADANQLAARDQRTGRVPQRAHPTPPRPGPPKRPLSRIYRLDEQTRRALLACASAERRVLKKRRLPSRFSIVRNMAKEVVAL